MLWGLLDFSGIAQAWQHLQQADHNSALVDSHLAQLHGLAQRNRSLLEQSQQAPLSDAPLAEVEANIEHISALWVRVLPLIHGPEEGWLASAVAVQRLQYLQNGLLPAVAALRAQRADSTAQALTEQALALYLPFDKSLRELRASQTDRAQYDRHGAQTRWYAALRDFALLSVLLLLLSLLLSLLLPRLLSRSST